MFPVTRLSEFTELCWLNHSLPSRLCCCLSHSISSISQPHQHPCLFASESRDVNKAPSVCRNHHIQPVLGQCWSGEHTTRQGISSPEFRLFKQHKTVLCFFWKISSRADLTAADASARVQVPSGNQDFMHSVFVWELTVYILLEVLNINLLRFAQLWLLPKLLVGCKYIYSSTAL